MKAKCTKCEAVYNIDDAKIPEKGVFATCKKCQTRFQIKREETSTEAVAEEAPQDEIITCPYCSHVNIHTEKCAGCGKIFSDEEKVELTVQI